MVLYQLEINNKIISFLLLHNSLLRYNANNNIFIKKFHHINIGCPTHILFTILVARHNYFDRKENICMKMRVPFLSCFLDAISSALISVVDLWKIMAKE